MLPASFMNGRSLQECGALHSHAARLWSDAAATGNGSVDWCERGPVWCSIVRAHVGQETQPRVAGVAGTFPGRC